MKTLVTAIGGAICATILILACSDDSPPSVDAAVCDCPASEAPIAGRLMLVRGTETPVAPDGASGGGNAICPTGAIVLSGGCFVDEAVVRNITLREFGKIDGQEGHYCVWLNSHTEAQMVHAEATCLVPAQ
jgi:hypothetical protein